VRLAQIISYVFHPGLMPTLGLVLILNLDSYLRHTIPSNLKLFVLGLVFINTFVFPVLLLFFLRFRKAISSYQLDNRKERILPFGITCIFYFFTYNLIQKTPLPPIVVSLFLGMTISVVMAYLTTYFYKISIHMMGISGVLAGLLVLYLQFSANYFVEIVLVSLVWGLIGYARLKLKKHTAAELYTGVVVGFVSVFIPTYFGLTI
tara:strand:- start:10315 stop:10929 length:615 start_codon:yes stop_codon:yes gene_type:complete